MAGRKICISVDASPVSREALSWAASHVIKEGDSVVLVTVMEPSVKSELAHVHAPAAARGTLDQVGWAVPFANVRCEADPETVAKTVKFLESCKEELAKSGVDPSRVKAEPLVACIGSSQDIGRQILDAAEDAKCESLVMGSRGLGLGKRTVLGMLGLGSVSEYIVKHASCNVIVHKAR